MTMSNFPERGDRAPRLYNKGAKCFGLLYEKTQADTDAQEEVQCKRIRPRGRMGSDSGKNSKKRQVGPNVDKPRKFAAQYLKERLTDGAAQAQPNIDAVRKCIFRESEAFSRAFEKARKIIPILALRRRPWSQFARFSCSACEPTNPDIAKKRKKTLEP